MSDVFRPSTRFDDAGWRASLRRKLNTWFQRNARDLPWRRTLDPYHIWVSEIMLQQTQVVTVIPYFNRFIKKLPTIAKLAAAREEEVLKLWEGLGYYRRARQLHRAARLVVENHRGRFPRDADEIKSLPGIGRYTAGAIMSIAFDGRQPILEANTIRLFSRLAAYEGETSSREGQTLLWEAAELALPQKNIGNFNQALMELGSEVCTPRDPRCEQCPLMSLCPTFEHSLQESIPAQKRQPKYEDVHEATVVIRRRGQILLRRCDPAERWAGMWDFPRFPLELNDASPKPHEIALRTRQLTGLAIEPQQLWCTIKHGVTRFRITLYCYKSAKVSGNLIKNGSEWKWTKPSKLTELPLSKTGRQISDMLLKE